MALCFVVVVLGAYVRLTAAGLGCPDWPGCYGHFTPSGAAHDAAQSSWSRPLETGKAWHEMIHRYAVLALSLVIVAIAVLAVVARRTRPVSLVLAFALLTIFIVQALLGMLTVTWQLAPLIVTAHLLLGLTTLGMLWWLALSLPTSPWGASSLGSAGRALRGGAAYISSAHTLAVIGLVALGVQIALGGWTSSNYAAIACPDFPLCQHSWWPPADFRNGFVLWHGHGANYEGGLLANSARTAIHVTHRIGALVAASALILAAVFTLQQRGLPSARPRAWAVLGALALQLVIGVSMVVRGFPLWLATAHTAGAALLLLAVLALLRSLSTR